MASCLFGGKKRRLRLIRSSDSRSSWCRTISPCKMSYQFEKGYGSIANPGDLVQSLWRRVENSLERPESLQQGNRKRAHVFLGNSESQEQFDKIILCQSMVFSRQESFPKPLAVSFGAMTFSTFGCWGLLSV